MSVKKSKYKINKYKKDISAIGIDPIFAFYVCLYILQSYQKFCWEFKQKNINACNLINIVYVWKDDKFTKNAQNLLDHDCCIELAEKTMSVMENQFLSFKNYKKYYDILLKNFFEKENNLQKCIKQDLKYQSESSYFDHYKKALWAFTWVYWCKTLYQPDLINRSFYIKVELTEEKNLEYEDRNETEY